MLRVLRTLLAAAAVVLLPACGDDGGTGNNTQQVVGVYLLQTIDGEELPVVVEQLGDDTAEVTEGTVTLRADGTFSDVTELRITIGGVVSDETEDVSGTWTLNGSVVTFSPTGFASYSMTWDGGDTLTQVIQGFTLVYVR